MDSRRQAGSLYKTNSIACHLLVVYFSQVHRYSLWSSILVESVRQTHFSCIFQSSLLDRLDQNRQPMSILVDSDRQTLFVSIFYFILHPCSDREFYFSLPRETRFTSLYISRVYPIQRDRETCFTCLLFGNTPSRCGSLLVQSITGHRKSGRQRHSNYWPDMYQSILLSLVLSGPGHPIRPIWG